jgi:pimeloyl-ACP methyl ester carboxylesterase
LCIALAHGTRFIISMLMMVQFIHSLLKEKVLSKGSMKIQTFKRPGQFDLAYIHTPAGPGSQMLPVMFLGGYRSDMTGTKASFLEERCRARGQEFLRFDYSGHGASGGDFVAGTIGSWARDAMDIFDAILRKPTVLIGSSMGGWMAMLLALARPQHVAGLIGIAAAPDFTEELYARMTKAQQDLFHAQGFCDIPSDDSLTPYHFTKAFYTEARSHLLLHKKHVINYPVCLLQGQQDRAVPWQTAEKIAALSPLVLEAATFARLCGRPIMGFR